jgi:hypothetical protein
LSDFVNNKSRFSRDRGDRRRCTDFVGRGRSTSEKRTKKLSIQPSGLTAQNLAVPLSKTVLKIDSEFLIYFDGF